MIAVGVDTHKDEHIAAALDGLGQLLGEIVVAANQAGYRQLAEWLVKFDEDVLVGIEGAGSYGAGLGEHLQGAGIRVVEVERPRRRDRPRGKSDRIDALLAAKRVLAGDGLSTLRGSGTRAALQHCCPLTACYRLCVAERARALNQLQGMHVAAPAALRCVNVSAPATAQSSPAAWPRSTQSRSPARSTTPKHAPTWTAESARERPNTRRCARSSDTSPATSTRNSLTSP